MKAWLLVILRIVGVFGFGAAALSFAMQGNAIHTAACIVGFAFCISPLQERRS